MPLRQGLLFALLGLAAFVLVVGTPPLSGTNIAWLWGGDPTQHYLGWGFFRNAPWSFPLGASPLNGLEFSSSIIFSDSIPLFAFLFKPFAALLPEPFQYWGIWLLMCFILQGVFAGRLAALLTQDLLCRALLAALMIFTPAFLARLNGHYSLCAHWLLLAALVLVFTRDSKGVRWRWALLLTLAALTHLYLLVMCLGLWCADGVSRLLTARTDYKRASVEVLLVAAVVGVALWQAGAFMGRASLQDWGYGHFRMNLLSPIDPGDWSYVLPDLAEGPGDYEGFNYFGPGLLLVCLVALFSARRVSVPRAQVRSLAPLIVVLFGLTAFAISNKIGFATHTINVPIPTRLQNLAEIFRSSGRMFWPVTYCITLLAAWVVLRAYSARAAAAILAVAVVIQVADTSAHWLQLRQHTFARTGSRFDTPLRSAFWDEAAERYSKVRRVPAANMTPNYEWLAEYAVRHHMGTDSVYLARADIPAMKALRARTNERLKTGEFEPDTLYVLDEQSAELARQSLKTTDALMSVDGLTILAPGWRAR